MKKLKRTLSVLLGMCYTPVYLAGFLLNRVARAVLAVSYIMLLDGRRATDIIRNLFTLRY